jgi:hypothetical protein
MMELLGEVKSHQTSLFKQLVVLQQLIIKVKFFIEHISLKGQGLLMFLMYLQQTIQLSIL